MTAATPQLISATLDALNAVLPGKDQQIKLALTGLLANGHLLLEDLPGMGKTTLAHALAKVCGLAYKRVQFTSDLLPADLIGVSIFEKQTSSFTFHPGPVFSQIFLADELNRASPKAQSALLEAMEEQQVSVDGTTHSLPEPFFVIATQNPQSQSGTFPLPESQLDRFLLRISLGYPDPEAEREMLKGRDGRSMIAKMPQVLGEARLRALQSLIPQIVISDTLLDYIQRLIAHTRHSGQCQTGLSPRGAQALVKCAQSWALLQARSHVLPEDVQAVFTAVAGHRLIGRQEAQGDQLARHILAQVDTVDHNRA